MKAKLLSLLIPAALVASGAHAAEVFNKGGNKVDFYGKVSGLYYFSENKDKLGDNGDQSFARIGIKGTTQISDQLEGFGKWEYNMEAFQAEGSNKDKTRLAFAGLRFGKLGSLDYGRNDGVVYDASAYTDVLPEFGGDYNSADNFMQSRIGSALTYRNSDFFGLVKGLNFALQYQSKHDDGFLNNATKQNGDGFGMSMTWDSDIGVSVGAAMANLRRTPDQQDTKILGHGDKAEVYAVGAKYDANNIYLAAHYKRTNNATVISSDKGDGFGYANKADIFEAVAKYTFDFGLEPSLAYLYAKGKDIEGYSDQDLLNYVDIGLTYTFNDNMSTYVDYKINLLKENAFTKDVAGISTDNIVAVGLVYQF